MILQILYNLTIIASIGGFAACSCLVLYRAAQWVERQGVKPVTARELMRPARPADEHYVNTIPVNASKTCNNCGKPRTFLLDSAECTECGTVPAPKDVRTRRFTSFSGAKAKAENQALQEAKQ